MSVVWELVVALFEPVARLLMRESDRPATDERLTGEEPQAETGPRGAQ